MTIRPPDKKAVGIGEDTHGKRSLIKYSRQRRVLARAKIVGCWSAISKQKNPSSYKTGMAGVYRVWTAVDVDIHDAEAQIANLEKRWLS